MADANNPLFSASAGLSNLKVDKPSTSQNAKATEAAELNLNRNIKVSVGARPPPKKRPKGTRVAKKAITGITVRARPLFGKALPKLQKAKPQKASDSKGYKILYTAYFIIGFIIVLTFISN